MNRFTDNEFKTLKNIGFDIIENDDEESYAYCAQGTGDSDYWKKKAEAAAPYGGFSSYYPHYFLRINKKPRHFEWFGAPKLVNLNPRRAEFMGVFTILDLQTIQAMLDVIWEMEKRPLPERPDFELQRMPNFTLKH